MIRNVHDKPSSPGQNRKRLTNAILNRRDEAIDLLLVGHCFLRSEVIVQRTLDAFALTLGLFLLAKFTFCFGTLFLFVGLAFLLGNPVLILVNLFVKTFAFGFEFLQAPFLGFAFFLRHRRFPLCFGDTLLSFESLFLLGSLEAFDLLVDRAVIYDDGLHDLFTLPRRSDLGRPRKSILTVNKTTSATCSAIDSAMVRFEYIRLWWSGTRRRVDRCRPIARVVA